MISFKLLILLPDKSRTSNFPKFTFSNTFILNILLLSKYNSLNSSNLVFLKTFISVMPSLFDKNNLSNFLKLTFSKTLISSMRLELKSNSIKFSNFAFSKKSKKYKRAISFNINFILLNLFLYFHRF